MGLDGVYFFGFSFIEVYLNCFRVQLQIFIDMFCKVIIIFGYSIISLLFSGVDIIY